MDDGVLTQWFDEGRILDALAANGEADPIHVSEILAKARTLVGLAIDDIAPLMAIESPALLAALFAAAREVKEAIYGKRVVIFAPLYVSNLCGNECLYCAFRVRNKAIVRRALTQEEIAAEVRWLVDRGHKRLLLVAGEAWPKEGLRYVLDAIGTIYATRNGRGEIRRVNVNIAPLDADEFRRLSEAHIGTYQLFQETYHRATYARVHPHGRKADFDWRLDAIDRAMRAGIDDCGVGVLFGLADWRFELVALMQHARHLEANFGVGPHTVSLPRLEPAAGSALASDPPSPVSEIDFQKIIAILRLALPYTGLILSTRETAQLRRVALHLGISQVSAGSRTNPGGYSGQSLDADQGQFQLGDHRSLDEVVCDIARMGHVPSFCTACYRLGRTGADFMDLARPGEIKQHCDPNAVATFEEYLQDHASEETAIVGREAMGRQIAAMPEGKPREQARRMVEAVRRGRRDVFC